MKSRIKQTAVSGFLFICIILFCFSVPAFGAEKKVRVGYIDYSGFIESEDGKAYQGYGVAYLDKIAQYTGWEYEYFYGTWKDLLDKLSSGELDLICTAQYTPERAALYDYSDIPIGYESAVIYARKEDDRIYYEDYAAMNGMKIGLLKDSYQSEQLNRYSQTHEILFEKEYYNSDREMLKALNSGKEDLILTGAMAFHDNLKVVSTFDSSPFYIITAKGRPELLRPLNDALNQINAFFPDFEQETYQKYYGSGATATELPLTREESEFVKSASPIRVGCPGEHIPLSFQNPDTGEADGILPALIRAIAEKSSLPLHCVLIDDAEDEAEYLKKGQVDMMIGNLLDTDLINDTQILFSEPLTQETLVLLARRGKVFQNKEMVRVALLESLSSLENGFSDYFPQYSVQYYNTVEDALDAVYTGKADITIQNDYTANYYLQRKQYQSLMASTFPDSSDMVGFATLKSSDPRLISILNKTILCLPQKVRAEAITDYTISMTYQDTMSDILWYYRYQIGIIVALLLVLLITLALLFLRRERIRTVQMEAENYRRISERDGLTGVYNRQMFYKKTRQMLDQNPVTPYQFIYLNIENFKLVNDLFGTEAGDRLLCQIAQWVENYACEKNGTAGRLDADHFILCVPSKQYQGEEVYRLLLKKLDDCELDMKVMINCGVYEVANRSRKVQLMCDRAHLASNDSKGNILKPVTYYSASHREQLMQTQTVLNEMRNALEKKQFQIYLQPQVRMRGDKLCGAEALVRWVHPERGVIFPNQFIPIFEQNGFITKLDIYVYEEVCRLLKRWKEEGKELFPISTNLSRVNFYSRTLCEQLIRIADSYGVDRKYLELELTESAYSEDNDIIYDRLRELQSHGFRILMDDFGSGYSALNMLKDAPVDILKLDLRFLNESDPYCRSGQILKAIISMADALNIPVIAEGVETKEQVDTLKSTTCEIAQGYYYDKPVTVTTFEEKYF